jgi:hypothetical protein
VNDSSFYNCTTLASSYYGGGFYLEGTYESTINLNIDRSSFEECKANNGQSFYALYCTSSFNCSLVTHCAPKAENSFSFWFEYHKSEIDLVNNSFCYTLEYGGGLQESQNIATRNRYNCVNNSGDALLYQYITGTGADGTIDEMNVVNNDATAGDGILIYGDSNYVRNYTKCVFINNECSYFAAYIKIDFYYSIFDVNPTSVTNGAVINQKTGCVVGGKCPETIDMKTCVNSNDVNERPECKMSNPIVNIYNMYLFRKIKLFSLYGLFCIL